MSDSSAPSSPPSPTPAPAKKPWPMSWVVIAILCYIAIHTFVTIGFRKPERPHEPAAETEARRRRFVQASMEGWSRFATTLTATNETRNQRSNATVLREPAPRRLDAALPPKLVGIIPTEPKLFSAPNELLAAAHLAQAEPLRLQLGFESDQLAGALGEVLAYARDQHLFLFLQDESRTSPVAGPTPVATRMELALPAGALAAGTWHATLYTYDGVLSWQFVVE